MLNNEDRLNILRILSLTTIDMDSLKKEYKKFTGNELDEAYLQEAINSLRNAEV